MRSNYDEHNGAVCEDVISSLCCCYLQCQTPGDKKSKQQEKPRDNGSHDENTGNKGFRITLLPMSRLVAGMYVCTYVCTTLLHVCLLYFQFGCRKL